MMRSALLFALASGLAIAPAPNQDPAAGQPQPGQEQEAKPKEPGRVEGAVLLAGSDAPVRNAQVMLSGRGMGIPLVAASAENGTFVFGSVPPGEYNFRATHPRFVPVDKSGDYAAFTTRRISVAEGQAVKGVVFKMMPGAVVTGKVYDEYGDPQPRATVSLQRYRYINGKRQIAHSGGTGGTDDRGQYRLFNVPQGKYYVSAQYQDRQYGRNVPQTKPDEFGYPRVYYPGVLEVDTAMEIELRAGEERQGIDFRLVRDRAVRVKGKVLFGSRPVCQAYLQMVTKGSMQFGRRHSQSADPKTGEFEFYGVRPGIYTLIAMKMGDGQNERMMGRAEVQVASANVDGVVVNLSAGMKLPGQVIIEGDDAATVDFGERTTSIFLRPDEQVMFGGGRGIVMQDRSFELSDVMPGRYRVVVGHIPDGGYLSGAVFGDQDVHGQEFEVMAGAQGPLTVRIRMSAANITGVVEDDGGQPLPQVRVLLAPEASKRERSDLFSFNSTDQYGRFTLKNIVPGEYRIWALEKLESGQHMDPEFLVLIDDEGEKVEADDKGAYDLRLNLTEIPQ